LERALHGAVLAIASVQRDEYPLVTLGDELREAALARIERMRVHAARLQRREHHCAAFQRDLAFGRAPAEQHGDLAEFSASAHRAASARSSNPERQAVGDLARFALRSIPTPWGTSASPITSKPSSRRCPASFALRSIPASGAPRPGSETTPPSPGNLMAPPPCQTSNPERQAVGGLAP